ncbi:MAG: lysylphosphatidylglycerol synthase transmembrane domain-containing protein [Anaerolineales bacterium]|nr:MAG: lysylphosphatidylglycerol synthase transmembrane domain-containing protein [Anaerolineales bacterium]
MIDLLRKNRQTIVRIVGSLLALVLLLILLEEEGDGELFSALRRVSSGYFLVALAALFISRSFAAARWHVLLRSAGVGINFFRSLTLMFTGNFSSNFLPTTIGGDMVRLGGAMQLGYDRAICLASLVVDRLVGMAGMGLILPLGLMPVFSFEGGASQSMAVAALFQKGVDFARRTFGSFSIWWRKPLALIGSLLATLGNQAFIYLAIHLLLLGIDHHVPYWLVAGLYTLTYFVTLIPISINGLGVQELSMTFLLIQFGGLSSSESATIALLTRLLFILASLPGAFFLPSILAAMNEKKENLPEKGE